MKSSHKDVCGQIQPTGRRSLDTLSSEIPFLHPLTQPVALEQLHALQYTFLLSNYMNECDQQDPIYENEELFYRYFLHEMPGFFRYGILAKERQGDLWMTRAVVTPFSNDRAATFELAKKCTVLQLSPIHLLDVIGDFMSQAEPN